MKPNITQVLSASTWLMEPRAYRAMAHRIEAAARLSGAKSEPVAAAMPTAARLVGTVAVIDICGMITYKPSWITEWFGGTSIMGLQAQFRAALADPAVKTICFRIDSPGGTVDMVPEFAAEVFAARGTKPIIAVADTLVASAAYWIAAQADVIYTSASGQLGSIGVYTTHEDYSAAMEAAGVKVTFIYNGSHKVDGNETEPLPDEVRAELQRRVDEVGGDFVAAVARGRGVSPKVVLSSFGQGLVFSGKRALAAGLADKPGTLTLVLGKLAGVKGLRAGLALSGLRAEASAGEALGEETKADGDVAPEPVEACEDCGEDCPCESDECAPGCPDCGEGCPCKEPEVETEPVEAIVPPADDEATLALLMSVRR